MTRLCCTKRNLTKWSVLKPLKILFLYEKYLHFSGSTDGDEWLILNLKSLVSQESIPIECQRKLRRREIFFFFFKAGRSLMKLMLNLRSKTWVLLHVFPLLVLNPVSASLVIFGTVERLIGIQFQRLEPQVYLTHRGNGDGKKTLDFKAESSWKDKQRQL